MYIHQYEYGINVYDEYKQKDSISRVDKDEEQLREIEERLQGYS